MKPRERVRVRDGNNRGSISRGTIVVVANDVLNHKKVPLIALDGKSRRMIWGDECVWFPEEKKDREGHPYDETR